MIPLRTSSFGVEDQTPPELLLWDAFVNAKTAEERCHTWLARVCSQIAGARMAAILVESSDKKTYVPISVWPEATPDFSRLAPVVEFSLRERRGIVQPASVASEEQAEELRRVMHIAYPLMLDQHVAGVVVLEAACAEETEIDYALREIHWGSAWLTNLLAGKELDEAQRGKERTSSVLEVVAVALRHGKLQQTLFEVANELRHRFACARVAIGLADHGTINLAALSEAATFEKHTSLAKAYVRAMEEAMDRGSPVLRREQNPEETSDDVPMHDELRSISGASHVLSQPLIRGAKCIGVLTLERNETDFDENDVAWMDALATLLAPVVEQRRDAERSSLARMLSEGKALLTRLFGPRYLVWKAGASLLVLFTVLMVLVPIDYRVNAKTVIEGEIQRVAAAPFEGFIGAAYVRAGDTVKKGQVLAQLDDRELKIEQARWSSERDQYDNRLREAMATHDLTAVQVVGAQLRQAEAQLALVTEKISRARLEAPYDGIVVSGDLSQQIGAPVEAGKKLFEIAPLESYRVILQVDEREIRHVQVGQAGHLVITGIVGDPIALTVQKVTPVATSQDGKNFFRVEASLSDAPPRLRPGMEGVGKIEVGDRSLWWILTHSFTDWLLLSLWAWLP